MFDYEKMPSELFHELAYLNRKLMEKRDDMLRLSKELGDLEKRKMEILVTVPIKPSENHICEDCGPGGKG